MNVDFFDALRRGDVANVRQFARQVDAATSDRRSVQIWDSLTPLQFACIHGSHGSNSNDSIVRYLVEEYGADVNATDELHDPPLLYACAYGHFAIVQYLVEHANASLTITNCFDMTCLHIACREGHVDVVQYLVEHQGDTSLLDVKSDFGSPLCVALMWKQTEVVRYLIEQTSAPIDAKVFELVWKKKFSWEIKQLVIEQYYCRFSGRPYVGVTTSEKDVCYAKAFPLHAACACPIPSIAAFAECLEKFSNIEISKMDMNGRLPIHAAIDSGRPSLLELVMVDVIPSIAAVRDPVTGFYPFEAAAVSAAQRKDNRSYDEQQLDLVYRLLRFSDPAKLLETRRWKRKA